MNPLRIVVLGTMASNPYAGMAWMHMQIAGGLKRLGHDVYYFETTSNWPYDPIRQTKVDDAEYAAPYLARVAEEFGFAHRWALRRSFSDKEWMGMSRERAEDILSRADLVLNVAGSTRFREEGLTTPRLIYFGTDPVYPELMYEEGDTGTVEIIDEHDDVVTYGENIGRSDCKIPPLPRMRGTTRQPVLIDLWSPGEVVHDKFTTVGNWQQEGREATLDGEVYLWSKHHEFMKFIDLPHHISQPIELAMNLEDPESIHHGDGEPVRALGVPRGTKAMLSSHGWNTTSAVAFSLDPWKYREYICSSKGEFTVARDLNVRLRSGWFSERSACYLAAGRPVITQDTGFGTVLPTGEGLFAFSTMKDIITAFEAISEDYARHSRAAREIAVEYFSAERVMTKLLKDLGN